MGNSTGKLAGGAAILGGGALLSRLLGFARDALFAHVLGAGWIADAFLLAFRLPNFWRRLVAEGAFALAFVPQYSHLRQTDPTGADAFSRAAFKGISLFGLGLAVLGMLGAPALALLLAPGFASDPERLDLTAHLLRICLGYLPLASGAAILSGILLSRERYGAPSISALVLNLALISAGFLAIFLFPAALLPTAFCLGLGLLVGGFLQGLSQMPALRMAGWSLKGPSPLLAPENKKFLKSLPLVLAGAAPHQLTLVLAAFLASFEAPGSIAALYFAERLLELPLGLVGVTVGLAALGELSGLKREDGSPGRAFDERLCAALRLTLLFSLPATAGLTALANPLVSMLFGHGAFSHEAVNLTAGLLWAYAWGLPATAASRPLLSAANTLRRPGLPLRATLFSLAVATLSGPALASTLGTPGIALAVSLGAWSNTIFLFLGLKKYGLRFSGPWSEGAIYLILSLLLHLALTFLAGQTNWPDYALIGLFVPTAGLLYLGACAALGSKDLMDLISLLRKSNKKI